MAYRKTHRYSRQLAAARAAKAARREAGPGPAYPAVLPALRRVVTVEDYDATAWGRAPVVHRVELYRSGRVDQYVVVEQGVPWAGRWGWARVLAVLRQRFPRMRGER